MSGGELTSWGFFGADEHGLKEWAAERGGHRDVGGVSSPADYDAALALGVVAGVEGPPPVAEPDLHPGREVHRGRVGRDVHVRQVPEDVPGGDVQRPAER